MSFFSILIISLLFLHACGKSKDSSKNNRAQDSTTVLKALNDTTPLPEPPQAGLAPGQAKVGGHIIKTESNGANGIDIVMISVDNVLGYGASTRPIPVNDTLSVKVRQAVPGTFKIGKHIIITIQQNISNSSWSMVKLDE